MHHRRPSILILLLTASLFLMAAVQVGAEAYEVKLLNGNVFTTKAKPVEASYDPEKLIFHTVDGNQIAIRSDEIESIELDVDNRSFGTVLDVEVVVIGISANDYVEPEPGELESAYRLLPLQGQSGIPGLTGPIGIGNPFAPQQGYTAPQFAEPNTGNGGGIPLSFVNTGIAPLAPYRPPSN